MQLMKNLETKRTIILGILNKLLIFIEHVMSKDDMENLTLRGLITDKREEAN